MNAARVLGISFVGIVILGCSGVDVDGDGFKGERDCAPWKKSIHPDARERCDEKGEIDEDCDGLVDDEDDDPLDTTTFYEDRDGDGFGNGGLDLQACRAPEGAVANEDDCDDNEAGVHPGATEVCDDADLDEDCDGRADDDDEDAEGKLLRYADADGDDYGDDAAPSEWCDPPRDQVEDGGDCDDADRAVNPGASERCDDDDVDEDCDGLADDHDPDANGQNSWYTDADGDGYGAGTRRSACDPEWNEVGSATDCDDANDSVHPGAAEICDDGVDQDCDDGAGDCFLAPSTDSSAAGAVVLGVEDDAIFAWSSTVRGGDTDGDGRAEVWLSQPGRTGLGAGGGGAVQVTGRLSGEGDPDAFGLVTVRAHDAVELGYAITVGDLTGDGRDDLVLGSPLSDTPTADSGAVHVLAGPVADGVSELDALATRTGDASSDYLGAAVAAGDWDGDGVGDLFVAHAGPGAITGELGPVSAGSLDATDVADVVVTTTTGDYVTLGDVDGDGLDELAVQDWGLSRVWVYAGGATGTLSSGDAQATLDSGYTAIALGYATRLGPDLDRDGYGDLVAGAPNFDDAHGRVEVLFGPLSGTSTEGDLLIECTAASANCGYTLAAEGDLDGDGFVDLVVGAPLDQTGAINGGAAHVFGRLSPGSWSESDADYTILGVSNYGWTGLSLGMADLDADDRTDLVIGGYNLAGQADAGVAWVWYGAGY